LLPEAPSAAPSRIGGIPAQEKTAETTVPVSAPEVSTQKPAEPGTGLAAATDTQTGADPSRPFPSLLDPPGAAGAASLPPAPGIAQVTATVRATGEDGRIRWRGSQPSVHPGDPGAGRSPAAIVPPTPVVPGHMEPMVPPVSTPAAIPEEATPVVPETISLRLEPILKQLPLELETPEIRALRGSDTGVELPTQLVREQLVDGRVAISAGTFAKGLPETERPVFEKLAPDALIPIPLQEIFTKLPVSIFKPRSDQVEDPSGELIPTPFSVLAQEDAMRFERLRTKTPAARPAEPAGPYRAGTPPQSAPGGPSASAADQAMVPIPPEALPNFAKVLTQAIRQAPETLQTIFLRDDVVDLTSALQAVIHLPGVQGAVLNNAEGEPLAGYLGHLPGSAPVIRVITELLNTISQRFAGLQQECLESVSFHLGNQQITGFVDGVIYLIVVHTARPFRPGVREKIHAFMRELVRLSAPAAH
jgi:hypothetical protein